MKLGFDTGGTFTDFALLDDGGRVHVHKVLSTPAEPARAVLKGVDELLARVGVADRSSVRLFGATTMVTNTLLERKGARVAFLATRGFRDLLRIRTEARYDLYDLGIRYPEPLASRDLCFDVTERVAVDGRVMVPLDEAEVRAIVRELITAGVEAVAVCLLHAPSFPAHEQRIGAILAEEAPRLAVSLSSSVAPEVREYLRASTTVVNAYTEPVMRRHMAELGDELRDRGLDGGVYLMTSSGGLLPGDTAAAMPVRIIESGPAAGVLAAAEYGRIAGEPHVLSFDMGGTTAKLTLAPDGQPMLGSQLEVAHLERFKRGSGFPLKIHSIQTFEIGAGGGSIAVRDQLGLLRVGPRSAGAEPGPACYGIGGTEPTVTDADLLLGYLDPDSFLGGDFRLHRDAAARAIGALAGAIGVDADRCAWGIHDLVNENMAKAAGAHAAELGADLRRFTLVAFGGAGPVHAYGLARKLGIGKVICPVGAGVMSAIGLLLAPVAVDLSVSRPMSMSAWDHAAVRALLGRVGDEAREIVRAAGVPDDAVTLAHSVDMRHVGQGHEVQVALPDTGREPIEFQSRLRDAFATAYETLYGRGLLAGTDLEAITWRVRASGPREPFTASVATEGKGAERSRRGSRRVYFDELGGFVDTAVHDHYALGPGTAIDGPAIVEQRESTVVVGPQARGVVDAKGNVVMEISR
jgi:N-methylhydantoinase A